MKRPHKEPLALEPLIEDLRDRPWQVLHRLSVHLIARSADLESSLASLLAAILAATRGDRAVVFLKEEDGSLAPVASHGAFDGSPGRDRVSWTVVQRVFQQKSGVYIPRIDADSELAGAASVEAMEIRSAICVPLEAGVFFEEGRAKDRRKFPPYLGQWREVLGVVYVDSLDPREPYSADDLALLEALANITTTAIVNARLYREATRDPASGLLTRRHFEVMLRKIHPVAKRHGFPYGVLLAEVDEDHPHGPDLVGRVLASWVRRSDLAARHGSHRYAVLLPYTGPADVRKVATKIAGAVEGLRIGASAVPKPAADGAAAVEQADRALAASRAEGAGSVVFWTEEIGIEGPRADPLAEYISGNEGEDYRRLEGLVQDYDRLRQELSAGGVRLLGDSAPFLEALERARKVAPTDASVLVTGESGTGKENLARAVHAMSHRAQGPLVVVDCGAIPEQLLESELFGHEAGAFTGAARLHVGKCERADGGTIFLDEIGELPLQLQVKILRFLQQREIERVGGTERIPVDVRVVAATNRDLAAEVERGTFRQDLYYRLNVVSIHLPPLRSRGRDVLVLARHLLERFSRQLNKPLTGYDEDAIDALLAYGWPGNVRELENRIQQAAVLAEDTRISAADLALPGLEAPAVESFAEARNRAIEAFEKDYITATLARFGGDVGASAKKMGLSERRFRELRQKYGIEARDFKG